MKGGRPPAAYFLAWPGGMVSGTDTSGAGADSGTGAGAAWTFGRPLAGGTFRARGAGCCDGRGSVLKVGS